MKKKNYKHVNKHKNVVKCFMNEEQQQPQEKRCLVYMRETHQHNV